MENQIRDAILTELQRQSEDPDQDLRFSRSESGLVVDGEIDLDALVFVIVGSLAGGP
nr:hypothetical protein [Paracoccus saliphilus]